MKILAYFMAVSLLAGCFYKEPEKIDWARTYIGTRGAESQITLTLGEDKTFFLAEVISGDTVRLAEYQGMFIFEQEGKTIVLQGKDGIDQSSFKLTPNGLEQIGGGAQAMKLKPIGLTEVSWYLEKIGDESIKPSQLRPFFYLDPKRSRVRGFGGCNRIMGTHKSDQTKMELSFHEIASSKMLCEDIQLEQAYLDALKRVRFYKLEGPLIFLRDEHHKNILEFHWGQTND